MGLLALLPAFLVAAHTQDKISVYSPVHMKAALLAKKFDPALIKDTNVHLVRTETEFLAIEGQAMWFDTEHNKIKFRGPDGPDFLQYFELFDYAPKTVSLHVQIKNLTLGTETSADVRVSNNSKATVGNSDVDLTVNLQPRINEDGTITISATTGNDISAAPTQWTYRGRTGEAFTIDKVKTLGEGSAAIENCSVTISAKIVD
jgi:hypothetical protein